MLVAKLTERAQKYRRCDPHTTFALDGFDKNCSRRRPDRALDRFKVTKRDLVEAVDRRSEAFQIFLVTGCGDCSAKVRPWKAPSNVMMRYRSGLPEAD